MRRPSYARLGRAAAGAAETGQPDGDLAEQRRDLVLAVVLHPASGAAVPTLRTARGMNPGLCGDDLLLHTGQEPLALGQGQPQAGQVGEVVGPGDLQNVGAVLRPVSPDTHQSYDPGHVVSTLRGHRPKIPLSVSHPQSRDGPALDEDPDRIIPL